MVDRVYVVTTVGRTRATFGAAFTFAATALCIWMGLTAHDTRRLQAEGHVIFSIILTVIFGAFFILAAIQIVRPTRLELSAKGIRQLGVWPIPLIAWDDIAAFGVARTKVSRTGLTQHHVCLKLTPEAERRFGTTWWRAGAPAGYDYCLYARSLSWSVKRLCRFLEKWRRRYSVSQTPENNLPPPQPISAGFGDGRSTSRSA